MAIAAGLHVITRFHPDSLDVPGSPEQLRHGADRLEEFIAEVGDIAKRLRQADAPKESRGPTVRALSNVAGRLGRILEADNDQLSDVAELARRQADLLDQCHDTLEETRRRWREARQDLRDEIEQVDRPREGEAWRARKGRGDGDIADARQLIRAMDHEVLQQVAGPLRRLAGLEFTERAGAVAFIADGRADQAATRYRNRVQAAFDDLIEALRRVNRADERLIEQLPRHEKAIAVAFSPAAETPESDQLRVSRPTDISEVSEQIDECAQALNRADDDLPHIRRAFREGRMTPEDERIGSMEGFQRTWMEHFQNVREDLQHARKSATETARQLRELDERGARDIRRNFRSGD